MNFSDDRSVNEIFDIDLAGFDMSGRIIYAPLHGISTFVRSTEEKNAWLEKISAVLPVYPPETGDFRDLTSIVILPTHRCNFNCAYCYSAMGRSTDTLSEADIRCAIDYFLATRRSKNKPLRLNILGGGEPLTVPQLTLNTIEYACEKASGQGFRLSVELVTNGSLLNDDICRALCRYPVSVGVSFEIIPEIQRQLRGSCEPVSANLALLEKYRIPTVVQATITPQNVCRMPEMYEILKNQYPWIKTALFEPVISGEFFPDAGTLQEFHQLYMAEYQKLRRTADRDGTAIRLRLLNHFDRPGRRGCEGRFCITPQAQISICFCSSSPAEPRFAEMCYGTIRNGRVEVDENKFREIISRNADSFPFCRDCFARWNCAGGCMLPNQLYSPEQKEVLCRFTRELYVRELFRRHCVSRVAGLPEYYPYRFNKTTFYGKFKTDCYLFDCHWGKAHEPVTYQLNFYHAGNGLLLTDFFPFHWRNEPDCVRRSTSAEGNFVNVRKIVQTCFIIFLLEYAAYFPGSVMVIRGNDRDPRRHSDGITSQKIRVYYKILKKMAENCGFATLDRLTENFFFILPEVPESGIQSLLSHYANIKTGEQQS